eukprot:1106244-Prymnesium_polylepis.3
MRACDVVLVSAVPLVLDEHDTSGCIVTCVWSHVCDERVRGGARAPPHMRLICYKVLTVGKVYRPSRTSSLHRRRSRPPQV